MITEITVPEISKWRFRRLEKRHIAILLNAMSFSIRGKTVKKECVIFATGIREKVYYEIL
jgi:putative transposase